eukprot:scaffold746_cov508-Prasinococcus_capsulatus_cf.AAC.4
MPSARGPLPPRAARGTAALQQQPGRGSNRPLSAGAGRRRGAPASAELATAHAPRGGRRRAIAPEVPCDARRDAWTPISARLLPRCDVTGKRTERLRSQRHSDKKPPAL